MATAKKKTPNFSLEEARDFAISKGYQGDSTKVIKAIWYLANVNENADATELLEAYPEEDPQHKGSVCFSTSVGIARSKLGLESKAPSGTTGSESFSLVIDGRKVSQPVKKLKDLATAVIGPCIEKEEDISWVRCKEILLPSRGRSNTSDAIRSAEITNIRNLAAAGVSLDVIALSFRNWSKGAIEDLLSEEEEEASF